MSKIMLIDATHPEETRVAVASNGHIEDFDFEARDKRQLRGNIYLAKVTRVEPSLQAAFVDYGGNRHGFLAFSEIHPDYYQIPKEDRDALMAEAARDFAEAPNEDEPAAGEEASASGQIDGEAEPDGDETGGEETGGPASAADASADEDDDDDDDDADALARRHAAAFQRKYKIQEVIRRRQVMLIQIVKEERGNKGAAVTTYLSLAGRYCVLMPNTARGGGISRKITNTADRRRLKKITSEFELPRGSGLIVRTAGAKRTKGEIRRDFEYLSKLWEQIVSRTMEAMAPTLIHEEGHLVLRAVRDLYDKDIEQIVVAGEDAYREAKTFVRMLMPSHARKVHPHAEGPPLFVAYGIEDQLESIFNPTVQLPSGGYIVINQTEALVAIDVNSGKATRERNVETTALKTNLEAASEACRQMRLRDLAGLIVIDFIDMEDAKNNRAVERRMKDSLKIDRARVQTGRISQFGLFEISRQRRRAGVLELTSDTCRHCAGTGRTRSVESAALQVLRTVETRAADERVDAIHVEVPADVALYILNEKRSAIAAIEAGADVTVRIEASPALKTGEHQIEAFGDGGPVAYRPIRPIDYSKLRAAQVDDDEDAEIIEDEEDEDEADADLAARDDDDGEDEADAEAGEDGDGDEDSRDSSARRRRGRRGGRRRRGREGGSTGLEVIETDVEDEAPPLPSRETAADKRERGRGRRRRGRDRGRPVETVIDGGEALDAIASAPFLTALSAVEDAAPAEEDEASALPAGDEGPPVAAPMAAAEDPGPPPPQAPDLRIEPAPLAPTPAEAWTGGAEPAEAASAPAAEAAADEAPPVPAPVSAPALPPAAEAEAEALHAIHAPAAAAEEDKRPRKTGWWNRRRAG